MLTIRRAGLIGDIHAEDDYLDAAIDFLSTQRLDAILCTGDVVDGPGDPNRCANLLVEAGVVCVKGNHDRWLISNTGREMPEATPQSSMSSALRDYLLSLPVSVEFESSLGLGLLCHGVGSNDMRRLTPDDYGYALTANDELQDILATDRYRILIGGHTHRSMVKQFGTLTVINPGTLLRRHDPGFAVVDFDPGVVQFYTFDGTTAIHNALAIRMPA